jgi:hypothetical protein
MHPQLILTAMFRRPHCGQAGVFWNGLRQPEAQHPARVSNGFHLERDRKGPYELPLVVCDHCDEFQTLRASECPNQETKCEFPKISDADALHEMEKDRG